MAAFLDCDTFPENNNFIANYVNQINSSAAKAFGGLIYSNTKPNNQLLRWVFGKNRESIPLSEKNPYTTTFVSNFLIQNLCLILFDEKLVLTAMKIILLFPL
jgi:hypothetical protein